MSHEEMTPEEVKAIAAEIDEYNARFEQLRTFALFAISHLYDLPIEAYVVWYQDSSNQVFFRNDEGKLQPASTKTYASPDYTRPKLVLRQE